MGKPHIHSIPPSGDMMHSVKKLLIILMLLVLPLQFSWAVAAVYCQHESGLAVKHFGHHEHKHQAGADSSDSKGKVGQVHNDCGYCHALNLASFPSLSSQAVTPPDSLKIESHSVLFSSYIPDGPRRPDRRLVA